jgi:hypothetical protein
MGKVQMIPLSTLLYGLVGLALVVAVFAAGYFWARRNLHLDDIRHRYVMAGFFLSLMRAMSERKYDLVAEALRHMANSNLESWHAFKSRLPQSERSKLQELSTIADLVAEAGEESASAAQE